MTGILISGTSGFIASHLKQALPDSVGLDWRDSPYTNLLADVCKYNSQQRWDVVYHLAAQTDMAGDPSETYRTNICGLLQMLAVPCDLFVFASSVGVYKPLLNPYNLSKHVGEELVRNSGVPYLIFRFANIYGLRSRSVVQKFIRENPITIYGGRQVRDYTFIDDLVKVLKDAPTVEANRVYSVGTGKGTTVNKLAETVMRVVGQKTVVRLPYRDYEVYRPVIRTDFPCPTTLEEGIRKCL